MDHWGDPWADNNADEDKSPTKHEITSSLPPTHTSELGRLDGFLDDAGWGNQDGSFGDWTLAPETQGTIATEHRRQDSSSFGAREEASDYPQWASGGKSSTSLGLDAADWSGAGQDRPGNLDNERSETSGSSTTIQPDEVTCPTAAKISQPSPADDASSARASTSPSETSHNDAPVESPRTSIEEEHSGDASALDLDQNRGRPRKGFQNIAQTALESKTVVQEDSSTETGTSAEATDTYRALDQTEAEQELVTNAFEDCSGLETTQRQLVLDPPRKSTDSPVSLEPFPVDITLLDQLFPTSQHQEEVDEAPDDPIHSTTGRKAWYRLTRKQTMREYNSGAVDDNHVRVTWVNSQIRTDVNKVVGRWAREDRTSGTGPGARASFYWDTSATVDPAPMSKHSRTLSTVPAPHVAASVRQSLPPLPTNTSTAFNWSSSTISANPWDHSPVLTPMPLLAASPYSVIASPLGQIKVSSADITSRPLEQTVQKRVLTPVTETPVVTSSVSPPPSTTITKMATVSSDPWSGLEAFDTTNTSRSEPTTESFDDDDDWGEMVSTPTVSTPTTESTSQSTTRNNTLSTLSSTPHSVKRLPAKDESIEAMHASPIVRLKSTISPTSAIFSAKSFIPLHVEQGPIGPGLLKPANLTVSNSAKTSQIGVPSSSIPVTDKPKDTFLKPHGPICASAQTVTPTETMPVNAAQDNDIFRPSFSTPNPESSGPLTSPPATDAAQPSTDSWADADFSFFESAAPASTQSNPNTSNLFSVFEAPQGSTSAAAVRPFTRSLPHALTPPPLQPLTGATNSAQRRKEEEDEVLRDILSGLPDLRYMLR